MKTLFFLLGILSCTSSILCQRISIISAEDDTPLTQAHVLCRELANGEENYLLSDAKGMVQLSPTAHFPLLLVISNLGYSTVIDTLNQFSNKIYALKSQNITINEVIITAQYSPSSPEKAVHKIKVIDRVKIDAMGAQNLGDVLSNELNIRISQDNVLGSSMSLQGVSGQNVKILIDGVSVTGRLNGNIDISQLNMNNVERIEIIEGPLSVSYGTDALAGTINIITKKTQKKSIEVSSANYYESNGNYNNSGRIGYSIKKLHFSISAGRNYFDGWRMNDLPFTVEKVRLADAGRFQDWKPKEQFFGTFYSSYAFNDLKLGYTSDYFYEQITNKGLPRLPYFETAFDDYYTTKRINNSINLAGKLKNTNYINLLFAYNHFERDKNTYYKDLTTLKQQLTSNSGDQDTTQFKDLTLRGTISTSKDSSSFNYELGYDLHHELGEGLRIKDGSQEIGDYALFASAEYKPIESLTLRPGLRLIHNTAYDAPMIPSFNIRYQIRDKITSRFSYARGFRAPSVKELHFFFVDINHNIVGNPDLKAENSDNFNFSLHYQRKGTKTLWKIDPSFFYNSISNLITLAQVGGAQYTYFNVDRFQTLGAQVQSEWAWQHFKFTLGGSYIGRYNQLSETHETVKFSYSPEGKCNLFYEWKKQNLTLALFYKYTGELPAFALNDEGAIYQTKINAYSTADVSLSKSFWKKRILVSIGSKNLFNVKNVMGNSTSSSSAHASSSNTVSVGMGRSYFMKLNIQLASKK